MRRIAFTAALMLAATVLLAGCKSSRNDGFDWGHRAIQYCDAGRC